MNIGVIALGLSFMVGAIIADNVKPLIVGIIFVIGGLI